MSMTKVERAYLADLERDLAFRWPTEAEPLPTVVAQTYRDRVDGWAFNSFNGSVEKRWTITHANGGWFNGARSEHGNQGGKNLYATEDDALLALRWALCRKFADQLRSVDLRRAALKGDADHG